MMISARQSVRRVATGRTRRSRWAALAAIASALAVLVGAAGAVNAADRQASFVIDANTGNVISAVNADAPRHPASLTKMMTLYIAFEGIEQGHLSYQTPIRISAHAAAAQPTKLDLQVGSEIVLIDAIKALVTHSANDVAIALAEHIGGSEEHFADMMTQKARQLGMRATTFKNASGLPNSQQFTTARDMVTLGLRLHDDFPEHFKLFALHEFRYNGHTYANHNKLLQNYEGTEGIKTGYTAASGFNLVASVKRGTKHVVGAVFGGTSASSRDTTMRTLLNLALFRASPNKTRVQTVSLARARSMPVPQPVARPVARSAPPTLLASVKSEPGPDRVEVARVRPVFVAPSGSFAVRQAGTVPADFKMPPIAAGTSPARPPRPAAQMYAAAMPTARPASGLGRGAPPSTFQQQAAGMGSAFAATGAPASKLSGLAVSVVQIGAYGSAAEAQRQLEVTRAKATDLIGNAPAVTEAATVNGKSLWRARFTGFAAATAGTVCTALRRRQIDCLVARAD